MDNHRQYELIYVVSPNASEQEVTDLHAQVEATITRLNGQLVKSENWGRRKLAYEIGGHKEGTYVLEVIDGGGELMKELERRLKVAEQVLRYLVVRVDEELRAAARLRARRQVEMQKRAARMPAGQVPGQPTGVGTAVAEDEDAAETEE